MGSPSSHSSPLIVPLFPLPNVVLFPRAVMPLHIFEQRYRQMTIDVLEGSKQIAMALLKTGWEKSYYGKPDLEPVVCLGSVLSHEKLPDGKFNFLLQGLARARITREVRVERPYRVAELEPLADILPPDSELARYRKEFEALLGGGQARLLNCSNQFRRLLDSPLPAHEIADLVAFSCFDDAPFKQSLLSESDAGRRINLVLDELRAVLDRATTLHAVAQKANLN